ncbi:energy transducer TonB [Paraburkholderia adhaesiva]|uniref:energy transducer TonB n=1 Tax=Paraburkholderia adhaesiva TaxID=2883244 RepID=UPI001F27D08E|nr:energy transducer TonB [Paraburkholderia adhaesiva]
MASTLQEAGITENSSKWRSLRKGVAVKISMRSFGLRARRDGGITGMKVFILPVALLGGLGEVHAALSPSYVPPQTLTETNAGVESQGLSPAGMASASSSAFVMPATAATPADRVSPLASAPFLLPPLDDKALMARFSIAPGSIRADIIKKWAEEISGDPDIKRYIAGLKAPVASNSPAANAARDALGRVTSFFDGIARLSPDDRARLFDVSVAAMDNAPPDCGGLKNPVAITSRYMSIQTMSDDEFRAYLQTIFDLVKQLAQTTPVPKLTPEQRLQGQLAMSASLATALKGDPSATGDVAALMAHRTDMSAQSWCRAMRVSQHALQATAQPYRDWAMLAANDDTKQVLVQIMAFASLASLHGVSHPTEPANLSYAEKIQRRIRPNIVWAGPTEHLETAVAVHCLPNGNLVSATVVRSSGNADWDAAALRAVRRSDPMPADFDGEAPASFTITVRPG